MKAQAGDVDLNGDIVNRLREVTRSTPARVTRLRAAIADGSTVDVDEHLLLIARAVASAVGRTRADA